ncbi:MAG: DASS family sodium-coupled anion symporter [Myxococcota bacterium]
MAPSIGQRLGFWLGLLVGLFVLLFADQLPAPPELKPASLRVLGISFTVVAWWVSEAVPLAATALLPAAAFPLLGIVSAKDIAPSYASPFVLLLLGGFFLALAVEETGAHRRLALHILLRVGTSPRRLVLGFTAAATLVSMWISNAATALILMPIALALVERAEAKDAQRARPFAIAIILAVAYGASIGGIGTPVGTAPNLIALGALQAHFPGGPHVGFLDWTSLGVPIALMVAPLAWAVLVFLHPRVPANLSLGAAAVIQDEIHALGRWRSSEKRAIALFALAALLWISREDLVLGPGSTVTGWSSALGLGLLPDDGTIALLLAVAAFALPNGEGGRVLTWEIAARAPWDLVVLFGGGIALAVGFDKTGISGWLGTLIAGLSGASTFSLVTLSVLFTIFATELISNTALANILMPVLAAAAKHLGADPRVLLIPTAMACSYGFMMPAGTGPNAIAFGTGRMRMRDMVKAGFYVNLAGWIVLAAVSLIRFG